MALPENKKPIRIIYEYRDGSRYFIDGPDVKAFNDNMGSASMMGFVHGMSFNPINWKKIEKRAMKVKGGVKK